MDFPSLLTSFHGPGLQWTVMQMSRTRKYQFSQCGEGPKVVGPCLSEQSEHRWKCTMSQKIPLRYSLSYFLDNLVKSQLILMIFDVRHHCSALPKVVQQECR